MLKKTSKRKPENPAVQCCTVERETSLGTTLRLKLEPLANQQVKILEYYRKPKGSDKFKRVRQEEKQIFAFDDLNLGQSFNELFYANLKEAA